MSTTKLAGKTDMLIKLNDFHITKLHQLLDDLIEHHTEARRLAGEHRTAIAQADGVRIDRCTVAQQIHAHGMSLLERRRLELLGSVGAIPTATLTSLCASVETSARAKLLEKAGILKEILTDLASKQEAIRLASVSLMSHMQGIMRQVAQHVSGTGVYARPHQTGVWHAATCGQIDITR